jgi:hypothetical protein
MLQGMTVRIGTLSNPGYAREGVGDADVEKVKLGGGHRFSHGGFLIRWQLVPDQSVLDNLIMFPHGSRWEPSVVGYRSKINLLTTGKTSDLKKTRKILNGAGQSLSADLLGGMCPRRF